MRKIVIPTGYMASGSSAVTALIREFEGFCGATGSQEFIFLHCPLGVFDLEDKLLLSNNIFTSDEYLHLFRERMCELDHLKFWWPGNYRFFVGPDFMHYVDTFIESLIDYKMDQFWYMSERPSNRYLIFQKYIQAIWRHFFPRFKCWKPILNRKGVTFAYPSKEKFYQCARTFLMSVIDSISKDDVILDQLLLPHNLYRMDRYFQPGEAKVIVVERDPRDVFIQNKYFYTKAHVEIPYPQDVKEFCRFYRQIREMEKPCDQADILRIHFEELIYEYEKTVKKIREFLGVSEKQHLQKREFFKPEVSINNTQIYELRPEYQQEANYIATHLKEYLYSFPYKRVADEQGVFTDE